MTPSPIAIVSSPTASTLRFLCNVITSRISAIYNGGVVIDFVLAITSEALDPIESGAFKSAKLILYTFQPSVTTTTFEAAHPVKETVKDTLEADEAAANSMKWKVFVNAGLLENLR